ncbi:hypothetical protein GGI04_004032 [Coemansia thaxteri]|nr:hypothetical protein GGI04_004032 [Coemansia thaxteri]
MSGFHNDIFNRRSSSAFMGGEFASPAMPRPLFGDGAGGCRPQSSEHRHFAYVAGCEICEECVCRGVDIRRHEHRMARGCNNGFSARTEESATSSAFGNGRVQSRTATTMQGDAGFGFAHAESEMRRMSAAPADFFSRPFANNCPPPVQHNNRMRLCEDNVAQVFEAQHHMMHGHRQAQMHADARDHFAGATASHCRPLFADDGCYGAAARCEREEEDEVKVTTTTTTTTTTKVLPCEPAVCHTRCEPATVPVRCATPPPPPPPVIVVPVHDHHHVTVIPVGVKPEGAVIKPAEACCTWCKFLPCLSCPKPTNANARFKKRNFRLFPEYEFLADDLAVPRPTEYFPEHTHVASRADFRVNIPKVTDIAQRVYVDFIGDQMLVSGEHGRPLPVPRAAGQHLSPPTVRSSTRSSMASLPEKHMARDLPHGVARVFAKNFFVPRDTYDRDRAQVFIKPNGKLKIVVPALEP